MFVYFGTYTQKDRPQGIYPGRFNPETGVLRVSEGVEAGKNPSFLAIHPEGRTLYSVTEAGKQDGLTAFAIDPDTGHLKKINSQVADGSGACHVGLNPSGTAAIVSYYGSGSIASFPLNPEGRVGPAASVIAFEGSGPDPKRQARPHAHSANVDPAGRLAVVADLGTDRLWLYRVDAETAELTPHDPEAVALHPGAGPRHFAFHPTEPWAYVINELDATLTALRWNIGPETFTSLQTVDTLPDDWEGRRSTAEVVVHPSGRFVYGSNRGHDSIVAFAIDPESGELSRIGFTPSGGQEPRNFNIDPTGRWMLVCNQNTDDVQVFRIDPAEGALEPVGEPVRVPAPVCVKFLRQE
ncbi:MAG: lactonase family protein [Planctomycetota bacterium]